MWYNSWYEFRYSWIKMMIVSSQAKLFFFNFLIIAYRYAQAILFQTTYVYIHVAYITHF